jgi:hypothetical protein
LFIVGQDRMRKLGLKPLKCLGYNPSTLSGNPDTSGKRMESGFTVPCERQG